MNALKHIRVVLVGTSHPGNIGSSARAMKNMGLTQLYLVNPKQFPAGIATAMASGADDVLTNATVVNTLKEAIADCQLVLGTSARERTVSWQTINAEQCGQLINEYTNKHQDNTANIAIVFGNEQSGLSNDELHLCQQHVFIPTNKEYSSLNLSQAVQVISYEIHKAHHQQQQSNDNQQQAMASSSDIEGFHQHLQDIMHETGFLKGKQSAALNARIRKIFNKAQLTLREVNILRGILTAVQKNAKQTKV